MALVLNSTYLFTRVDESAFFNQNTTDPDDFYQQVQYGADGVPPEDLAGSATTERFVNAAQHVYRKFMAQLINSNMRRI